MKILVLCENYPNNHGEISMQYVHTRNVQYLEHDIIVEVLSFKSDQSYIIDGIKVLSGKDSDVIDLNNYDKIVSHAPNLKNHFPLLKGVKDKSKIIFFFHGHEVMNTIKHYPKPYHKFPEKSRIKRLIVTVYDQIKLKYWKNIGLKIFRESKYVFVSDWMYSTFLNDLNIKKIESDYYIIHNSIGKEFQENSISEAQVKKYEVVTIRSYYDFPKYAIDLVSYHAQNNPDLSFHVFGKGKYFDVYDKPDNLILHSEFLKHDEIMEILDKTKLVYLPTRLDAQGVLACEIASYGSKLLTSNLPICIEMMKEFSNVNFVHNEFKKIDFKKIISKESTFTSNDKFSFENTIKKEIDLLKL